MNFYPIQIRLQGQLCVVVGAGKVAERKVAGLRQAGARVRLVSPQATVTLQALAEQGELEWLPETFHTGHLDGAFLAMACTDDRKVNSRVTRDAQARGLLVLCADDPEAGNFVSPATITRGELVLTVSTGGKSPTLTAALRERLETEFGPEWEMLTEILGAMRDGIKTNFTEAGRKAAIRQVMEDNALHALLAQGRRLEAETRVRECLSSSSE